MTDGLRIPCNATYCLFHLRESSGSLGSGLAYSRYRHDTWKIWDVSRPERRRQLVMRYALAQAMAVDVNLTWQHAAEAVAALGFGTPPQHIPVPAPRGMEQPLPGGDWVRVPVAIRILELTTKYSWTAFLDVEGDLAHHRTVPVSMRLMSDDVGVRRGHGTVTVTEDSVDFDIRLLDTTAATPFAGDLCFGLHRVTFAAVGDRVQVQMGMSGPVVKAVASASLKQLLLCDDPAVVDAAALTGILRRHWAMAEPNVKASAIPWLRASALEDKLAAYMARVASSRRY